jgi:hypothetical protein
MIISLHLLRSSIIIYLSVGVILFLSFVLVVLSFVLHIYFFYYLISSSEGSVFRLQTVDIIFIIYLFLKSFSVLK